MRFVLLEKIIIWRWPSWPLATITKTRYFFTKNLDANPLCFVFFIFYLRCWWLWMGNVKYNICYFDFFLKCVLDGNWVWGWASSESEREIQRELVRLCLWSDIHGQGRSSNSSWIGDLWSCSAGLFGQPWNVQKIYCWILQQVYLVIYCIPYCVYHFMTQITFCLTLQAVLLVMWNWICGL